MVPAILMAMMSCEKTLNIDFSDKKDDVDKIEFTNTVTHNGKAYPITEAKIKVEDEGIGYYGYDEPIFEVQFASKEIISEVTGGNRYTCEYNMIVAEAFVPASNFGKMYNLNDKNTTGLFGFGKTHNIEGWIGQANAHNVDEVELTVYGYMSGNKGYYDEDGNLVEKKAPKVAKYYIEIERTYKEFYKVYIEFEDADGNKYAVSYKGDKEL